ncbi:hypothetical protein RUR49_17550 [Pseudoxanthobacter sp. M-2]|uniref:hypothetical protein n=1 Tax=Pseudoxanthobacter sp. M-2 TaxID=3078754 RepID=UPI0038FCB595
MTQPGLFDLDERYRRLSKTADALVMLAALIDFELFPAAAGDGAEAVRRLEGCVQTGEMADGCSGTWWTLLA